MNHSLQHDVSKAYDTVEYTIGKEMSMRRLGVPEWLIGIVYSLDNAAQVSVLTAHGLSSPYHPRQAGHKEVRKVQLGG